MKYAMCPKCGRRLCKGENGTKVEMECPKCGEFASVIISYLIKRIDIYANDEGMTQILKSIEFNFPIYKDGTFVRKILLDERVNVETLVVLRRN